jgi:hypothetical protein
VGSGAAGSVTRVDYRSPEEPVEKTTGYFRSLPVTVEIL